MGGKASKSEPQEALREVPSWCLRMQGLNDSNQCGRNYFPFKHQKVLVSAVGGMNHSLGILKSGDFVAWGSNIFGQLGSESDSYLQSYLYEKSIVSPVSFPKQFSRMVIVSISAGAWHSACVTEEFQVFTWGLGTDGQLGMNPKRDFSFTKNYETNDFFLQKPKLVEKLDGKKAISVHCGGNFTVVRTEDLRVFAFGYGKDGALGNGLRDSTYNPQEVTSLNGVSLKKIVCGFNHCLALSGKGQVFSWGNLFKDILNDSEPILEPRVVEGIGKTFDIACGDYHCCALQKEPNRLMTWGSNGYGQLGSNLYPKDFFTETPVGTHFEGIKQVACGGLFTMVKLRDGSVYAWGCNRQKQIGDEFDNIIREPTNILTKNKNLKKIVAGYSHVFLLSDEILNDDIFVNPKREVLRKTAVRGEDLSAWKDATSDRERV
jgi:alpha-tubulin suppressor-like RCC1 family protein